MLTDPGLSPAIARLLAGVRTDGFVVYCCGRRDDPTALVAFYPWPRHVDLITIRDFVRITVARVLKPDTGTLDVFAPQTAVWAYTGAAPDALRAVLHLVHPEHPDAPHAPFPAPPALHVPRCQQRPMTIRLPGPDRAGTRAARLALSLTQAG